MCIKWVVVVFLLCFVFGSVAIRNSLCPSATKPKISSAALPDSSLHTSTARISLGSKDPEDAFSLKSELWSEETIPVLVFVSLVASFIQTHPGMILPPP